MKFYIGRIKNLKIVVYDVRGRAGASSIEVFSGVISPYEDVLNFISDTLRLERRLCGKRLFLHYS